MQIVVAATDEQWNDFNRPESKSDCFRVEDLSEFIKYNNADAFFSLMNNPIPVEFEKLNKPVIINSVVDTLTDLAAPPNVYRINGWNTFLNRSVWEIAGNVNEEVQDVFRSLGIKINTVQDEPGFITARIIAMIINEAYFAVEDKVSSRLEIDTAMKLGTNYPYGPFEWAGLIGPANILALLQKLNRTDKRYQPSDLLIKEVKENNS